MGKKKQRPTIIHEDEHILVVNKPAGVLSIPDRYDTSIFNLYHYYGKRYDKIYIVHRIDRETSGLIIFAKNEEAHKLLNAQFSKHTVDKLYKAIVKGQMRNEEGSIDLPIGSHPYKKGLMSIEKITGKPSLTNYKVVERFDDYTLVDVSIKTGRTHQIRVHFQAINYPLAVDEKYGGSNGFYLSSVKKNYKLGKWSEEQAILGRVSLHAFSVGFIHPNGQRVDYEAPLPKDMAVMLKQLRKYNRAFVPDYNE